MNTKYLLSACFFFACQPESTTLSVDENCAIETPVAASLPASKPASAPVEVTPEATVEIKEKVLEVIHEEGELRQVASFGDKQFILLQPIAQSGIAKGKAKFISKKNLFAVRRDLDAQFIPESALTWVGKEVKLLQKDNTFCNAKISGLAALGQVYVFKDETPKKSASFVFDLSQERGGVQMVAEVEANDCKEVRFARLASLPTPEIYVPSAASKELRKVMLPKMRALPAYKEIQKRYNEYQQSTPTENKRWENYYGSKPVIATITTPKETLVYTTVQHNNGCGDFYGGLFALWRMNADDSLTLLYQGESQVSPDVAIDLDQDGTLEFLQKNEWKQLQSGTYQTPFEFYIPYDEEICGC